MKTEESKNSNKKNHFVPGSVLMSSTTLSYFFEATIPPKSHIATQKSPIFSIDQI